MTKEELVEAIAQKGKLSKKEAAVALTAVFDALLDAMVAGETVSIKGFGSFGVADRNARTGKNPQTGEQMEIAARRVPTFKAGKSLKDSVASRK